MPVAWWSVNTRPTTECVVSWLVVVIIRTFRMPARRCMMHRGLSMKSVTVVWWLMMWCWVVRCVVAMVLTVMVIV